MEAIYGKWVQVEGQPYAGLWFEFKEDGTFNAAFESMGIKSGGTYYVSGNEIDLDQNFHSLGMVGKFSGIFEIEDDELKLALASGPDQARPVNLEKARIYQRR